jgi:AcrR family transcriptional regulator
MAQNCHEVTHVVKRLKSLYDDCHNLKTDLGYVNAVGYPSVMETTTVETGRAAPAAGRRERKKQRTREALIDAAFQLFQEKGFEATTVEEIADEVDVSSRTFFRYFASKEDVVLTFQEEQFTTMLETLATRPASEPTMTAVRNAAVSVLRACEDGEYGFDPERFGCIQEMMEKSPAVFGRSLEHGQKKHAEITRVIAERMGVDPADDLRPHVAAGLSNCAFQIAFELTGSCASKTGRFSDVLDEVFGVMLDGLNLTPDEASSG